MIKTRTPISRREVLIGGAAAVTIAGLSLPAAAGQLKAASAPALQNQVRRDSHVLMTVQLVKLTMPKLPPSRSGCRRISWLPKEFAANDHL